MIAREMAINIVRAHNNNFAIAAQSPIIVFDDSIFASPLIEQTFISTGF